MSSSAFWGLTDKQWTRSGLTLAEGVTLATRLLESPLVPEAVYCLPAHAETFTALARGRCEVTVQSPAEMDNWSGFAFHRGVIALARRPEPFTLETFLAKPGARRLAVAPNLTDPENLGSVFRSALALGWDAVAVGPETCDPFSRRTAKVSMGAVYSHPPVELPEAGECLRLFDEAGWTSVALALEDAAQPLDAWLASAEGKAALAGPLAAWVGNEFRGVPEAYRSVCPVALVLPMAPGHDSLNAAVAAGIGFYRLATTG